MRYAFRGSRFRAQAFAAADSSSLMLLSPVKRAIRRAGGGVDLEPLRLGGQRHRPAPAHRVVEGGPGPLRRRKLCREVGQDQGHQPALAAEVGWEGVEETDVRMGRASTMRTVRRSR